MKYTLIILAVVGLSSKTLAGIGVLTPAEEEDVLAIWRKYCGEDVRSESAQLGDTRVYCKVASDMLSETLNHQVTLQGSGAVGEQVVFVKPPPVTYKHNVEIQGGGVSGQKTKIYVLPQKSEHEISSDYTGGDAVTQKPTVYFLKSGE